jgi:hypothetical protein
MYAVTVNYDGYRAWNVIGIFETRAEAEEYQQTFLHNATCNVTAMIQKATQLVRFNYLMGIKETEE